MIYNSIKKSDKKNTNQTVQHNIVLEGVLFILNKDKIWTGTMTNLNSTLANILGKNILPRSPSALRTILNGVVNRLRNRGVSVKFGRSTDRTRTRYVKFEIKPTITSPPKGST